MSLYKNLISIPFNMGMDTKTAKQMDLDTAFNRLQNVFRQKVGKFQKRNGFSSISKQTVTGSEITVGNRLDKLGNDLLLISDDSLHSYSPAVDRWITKGNIVPCTAGTTPIVRNNDTQVMGDSAYLDGLEVFVWEDSRGGVRYCVVDTETRSYIVADTQLDSNASRPKVLAFPNSFLITYIDGSDFVARVIAKGTPASVGNAVVIENGITDNPYSIAYYDNVAVFAYDNGTSLRVGYVLASGAVGSSGANGYPDPVNIGLRGRNAVSVVTDTVNHAHFIIYHDSAGAEANEVVVTVYADNLVGTDTDTIESVANVRNITGVLKTDNNVAVFYEISAVAGYNHLIRYNTTSYMGGVLTVGTPAAFKRSVGLASRAFMVDEYCYVTVVHESTLQSTYFVVRSDGFIVAKLQASTAAGLTRDSSGTLKSGLPHVSNISDTEVIIPLSVKNKLTTLEASTLSGFVGINRVELQFGSSEFDTDSLGQSLAIAGSLVQNYDGSQVVEHGFNLFPENVTTVANTSGSLTTSSTYRVRVLYEWVDGQGQIHRSAPSTSVSQALTTEDQIDVTVPTLRLTGKSRVKIVVYRTKADEITVYYRDNEAFNDTTTDTVTISLTQADTALQDNEILYTVGGVLDNTAPPSCKVVHKHKNRLFLAGLEDGTVQYSKKWVAGEGVAFNDGQIITPDAFGGEVSALSTLDDKLVLFKPSAIFTQTGDGPLDTGAQNDYAEPQLVSGEVGCANQKSIAVMPLGIMFQSAKGIYLLDRGLGTKYIGDRVEDYNHLTVTSAVVNEDTNQVRFTTETGECLVYNYYFDEWYVFSNYEAVSGINALDSYCHLKDDGTVNVEVEGQFNDNGRTITQSIETAWFQFAKMQGFQRVYRWALLGEFVSHAICRVKVAYDFENYYSETVYFNTQSGLGTEVYGDGDYGEAVVYGGENSGVFQFRSKPAIQKCQSIKLLIEDLDTLNDVGGATFEATSLAFEIGQKQGIKRLSESKTRGST